QCSGGDDGALGNVAAAPGLRRKTRDHRFEQGSADCFQPAGIYPGTKRKDRGQTQRRGRGQVGPSAWPMEASRKNILVIEDEKDVVDLLALNLRKSHGFKISTAADGAAGLIKARSERPDFIILDLMLPKMSGLEICRILKSEPNTRHIPILMLTAK